MCIRDRPTGHSTSGSHERYKSPERLKWETDNDCILKMGEWMVEAGITSQKELDEIRQNAIQYTRACKQRAWENFIQPVREKRQELLTIFNALPDEVRLSEPFTHLAGELNSGLDFLFSEVLALASKIKFTLSAHFEMQVEALDHLTSAWHAEGSRAFNTHLYAQGKGSALAVSYTHLRAHETPE